MPSGTKVINIGNFVNSESYHFKHQYFKMLAIFIEILSSICYMLFS